MVLTISNVFHISNIRLHFIMQFEFQALSRTSYRNQGLSIPWKHLTEIQALVVLVNNFFIIKFLHKIPLNMYTNKHLFDTLNNLNNLNKTVFL